MTRSRLMAGGLAAVVVLSFGGTALAESGHGDTGDHHGKPTNPGKPAHSPRPEHSPRPTQAPEVVAKAGDAIAGAGLNLMVHVKHAAHVADFAASAVVHFASGDVPVALTREGQSSVAHAQVPVAATEAAGPITIDFSVTFNGAVSTVTQTTMVVVEPSTSPEPTDSAEPSTSPELIDSAAPTATPDPASTPAALFAPAF